MPEPQKGLPDETRLAVDIDEGGVGGVGGGDAVFGHLNPAEAELVPPSGSPEGAERDIVVYRIGEVVAVGFHSPEESKGSAPVFLGLEDEGLLLGSEVGEEGVEGLVVEVFGFEGAEDRGKGGDGVLLLGFGFGGGGGGVEETAGLKP